MSAINNYLALAANNVATALTPAQNSQTASAGVTGTPGAKTTAENSQSAATGTAAANSTSTSTTSTSSANSEITSNDFLTLLVSELQNQDPTQPTDPDQYITQMVGVNSLQQLISINQELG